MAHGIICELCYSAPPPEPERPNAGWSVEALRRFAVEHGIELGNLRTAASIAARINAALDGGGEAGEADAGDA